jgi:hypothetical protein
MFWKKDKLTHEEVAQILEGFLAGRQDRWSWDGFTLGMSFEDPCLEAVRARCEGLDSEFPADKPHEYCNEQGRDVIREYIKQLRSSKRP